MALDASGEKRPPHQFVRVFSFFGYGTILLETIPEL